MEDNNITIGSDPEFVIMCGDSVSNALEIFSKVFKEDLSCIEPEEPDEEDLIELYNENPSAHLNDALNNTSSIELIKLWKHLSAKIMAQLFEHYKYTAKQIVLQGIDNKELLEISKIITEKLSKKDIDKFIKNELAFIFLLTEYIKQLDIVKIYKILNIDQQLKFNDLLINEILYFKEQINFDIDELPFVIRNKILESMNDNWEYVYDSPDDYKEHFCSAEIGCDGHSVTGEMRPRFGNDPIEHFNEILKLIKELSEALEPEIVCYGKELQIKAGTVQGLKWEEETILLGGHIHIGYDVAQRVYIAKYLGLILSMFVGIPLTLIEKPEEAAIRHQVYGKFNDIRPKEYGLEFRMPSSWLVSPEITIGALSLTYVVADEFIITSKGYKESRAVELLFEKVEKYGDIYHSFTVPSQISYVYKDLLKEKIPEIYENIKTMRLYPEYKEYIDYVFNMIEKGEYWNSDADILVTWSELF